MSSSRTAVDSRRYSPWDIFGLASTADPAEIISTYRTLVRKYHSDVNPELAPSRSNQAMSQLNWAMTELERNLEAWRLKAPRRRPWPSVLPELGSSQVTYVVPMNALAVQELEVIPGSLRLGAGESAVLAVRNAHVAPESIHVRFPTSLNVRRLAAVNGEARFEIALDKAGARQILDSDVQLARLEIVAKGLPAKQVYVSLGRVQPRFKSSSSSDTGWLMARLRSAERVQSTA